MYENYGFESIYDVARGEGFYIDDDGNWRPVEDADDFECEYYGIERDEIDLFCDEEDVDDDDDDFDDDDDDDDCDAETDTRNVLDLELVKKSL